MTKKLVTLVQAGTSNDKRSMRTAGTRGPRPQVNRPVPWAGGLTEDEAKRPGAPLLSMLLQSANDRGLRLGEMAEEIGVSQGYISQLRNGLRNIPDASDDFLAGCARFLGVPRIVCAVAAGKLKREDLYAEPDPADAANKALRLMQKDSAVGALMPLSAFDAPADLKLYLVMLFEKVTGKKLIASRVNSLADLVGLEPPPKSK